MGLMLSICVVTYNHEKYIKECIDSILKQDMTFEYEILVGDDCSKDRTIEVLKEFGNCVTIVERKENIGLSANMYDLLIKAKGKYVFTIAGDDYLCKTHILRKHVEFLEENPQYYMVTGWNYLLDVKSGEIRECHYEDTPREYSMKDFLSNGGIVAAEGTMRNTFGEDKLSNGYLAEGAKNNEEMKMWIYILNRGKVYILPEQFYIYRFVTEMPDASNYNSTRTLLEMFIDYYGDLIMLEKKFGEEYNFFPAIMHKANSFCIMFSDNIRSLLKFLCILRVRDSIKLFWYKVYLKTHNYKDPELWTEEAYLIRK